MTHCRHFGPFYACNISNTHFSLSFFYYLSISMQITSDKNWTFRSIIDWPGKTTSQEMKGTLCTYLYQLHDKQTFPSAESACNHVLCNLDEISSRSNLMRVFVWISLSYLIFDSLLSFWMIHCFNVLFFIHHRESSSLSSLVKCGRRWTLWISVSI